MGDSFWVRWHDGYADPGSHLADRLLVVQRFVRLFLDSRPRVDLRIVSVCAGDGRDVLGVLAHHPARPRVSARLVELDPDLVQAARNTVAAEQLDGVEIVAGDAGVTDAYAGAVPADLVLACGVFGNISDRDVETTVRALPRLCAEHGVAIWTRHRRSPDLTPSIRRWFSEAGFAERAFESPGGGFFAVGVHELEREPLPFRSGERLFTFRR